MLRPFSGILGLAFLLKWKKKWLLGCICGFIFACIVFVLPRPKVWQDYFTAMQIYVDETQGQARENLNAQAFKKPAVIEHTPNLEKQKNFSIERLDTAYNNFKRFGINISDTTSAILYMVLLIILSILFFRNRFTNNAESLFLFGFLVYILAEFFVIVPRGAYNVIQWLFPLSIIYLAVRRDIVVFILLITSLLMLHEFPFFFPGQAQLTEIMFISLTAFTMLSSKWFKPALQD